MNRIFFVKHIWTLLALSSIPIVSILYILKLDSILILMIQVPSLIALLIAQKLYYRRQMELCIRCSTQREFHNKKRYPELHLVCNNFAKTLTKGDLR